jgi:Mor family transcriptional regulator
MTESELNAIIEAAKKSGAIRTIHQRTVQAMHAVLRGEKWREVEKKYQVSQGGISKAFKRIGVSLRTQNS